MPSFSPWFAVLLLLATPAAAAEPLAPEGGDPPLPETLPLVPWEAIVDRLVDAGECQPASFLPGPEPALTALLAEVVECVNSAHALDEVDALCDSVVTDCCVEATVSCIVQAGGNVGTGRLSSSGPVAFCIGPRHMPNAPPEVQLDVGKSCSNDPGSG